MRGEHSKLLSAVSENYCYLGDTSLHGPIVVYGVNKMLNMKYLWQTLFPQNTGLFKWKDEQMNRINHPFIPFESKIGSEILFPLVFSRSFSIPTEPFFPFYSDQKCLYKRGQVCHEPIVCPWYKKTVVTVWSSFYDVASYVLFFSVWIWSIPTTFLHFNFASCVVEVGDNKEYSCVSSTDSMFTKYLLYNPRGKCW